MDRKVDKSSQMAGLCCMSRSKEKIKTEMKKITIEEVCGKYEVDSLIEGLS